MILELLLLGLAVKDADRRLTKKFGGNRPQYKKRNSYKSRRDNSWLDYAWFHDHGQNI